MADKLVNPLAYITPDPTDFAEGIVLHRDRITAADSGAGIPSLDPGGYKAAAFTDKPNVFHTNGAKNVELSVFGQSTKTVDILVRLWPYALNLADGSTQNGRGITILDAQLTTSGNSFTAGVHPVTGETGTGVTWAEASVATTSILVNNQVVAYTGSGSALRYIFDTHAYGHIYVAINAIAASNNVVIGLRRVS